MPKSRTVTHAKRAYIRRTPTVPTIDPEQHRLLMDHFNLTSAIGSLSTRRANISARIAPSNPIDAP